MSTEDIRSFNLQIKAIYIAVGVLVILVLANFAFLLMNPNQKIETIVGPVGPSGQIGDKGEPGLAGDPGTNGRDGQPGVPGPTGQDGKDGRDGQPGADGANGRNGTDGIDGTDGTNGTNGESPELRCYNNYVEWKYPSETTWHQLYKTNCNRSSVLGE